MAGTMDDVRDALVAEWSQDEPMLPCEVEMLAAAVRCWVLHLNRQRVVCLDNDTYDDVMCEPPGLGLDGDWDRNQTEAVFDAMLAAGLTEQTAWVYTPLSSANPPHETYIGRLTAEGQEVANDVDR
jgi:hypothetical protein